ncbi:MAG: hypothetical protein AB8F34_06105 [Akkermansiaceae bacterium]
MTKALKPHSLGGQLRYWSIHCGLTALPSFCIALTFFNSPLNIAAMLCGIATFIIGYTAITATPIYGKLHDGLIGKSVRLGTRIRMIISLIGLPFLIPILGYDFNGSGEPPTSAFFTVDFWFGYAAVILTAIGGEALGMNFSGLEGRDNIGADFAFTYLTTIVEGLLISISLVLISFFALIILNGKQNRKIYQQAQRPPGM